MKLGEPKHVWQLTFEGDWPTAVAFLGDSRHVVAGNQGGRILLWELPESPPEPEESAEGGKKPEGPPSFLPRREFQGHANGVTRIIPLEGGKRFVSASLDRTLRIWETAAPAAGTADVVLDMNARREKSRRMSEEERAAVLGAPGIEVEAVTACEVLEGHRDWVQALGLSADGRRLISGDDSCLTLVWDLKTRKPISQWTGYDRVWVTSAALSPNGSLAFTGEYADSRSSFDRPAAQARLWNAEEGSLHLDLLKVWTPETKDSDRVDSYGYAQTWGKLIKRGLVCATFSPDGRLLAVGQGGETDKGQVHLVDVESGKILRTVSNHRYGICDLAFSADGRYLLTTGRDTMVRICQVEDGKEVATLGKTRGGQFTDWLSALAVSPDQQWVAAADIAGLVHLWSLA